LQRAKKISKKLKEEEKLLKKKLDKLKNKDNRLLNKRESLNKEKQLTSSESKLLKKMNRKLSLPKKLLWQGYKNLKIRLKPVPREQRQEWKLLPKKPRKIKKDSKN
tara:strand:- start:1162 stop:1479 length:318 start_codon:yes stop_codon:yes gene_type:complete